MLRRDCACSMRSKPSEHIAYAQNQLKQEEPQTNVSAYVVLAAPEYIGAYQGYDGNDAPRRNINAAVMRSLPLQSIYTLS